MRSGAWLLAGLLSSLRTTRLLTGPLRLTWMWGRHARVLLNPRMRVQHAWMGPHARVATGHRVTSGITLMHHRRSPRMMTVLGVRSHARVRGVVRLHAGMALVIGRRQPRMRAWGHIRMALYMWRHTRRQTWMRLYVRLRGDARSHYRMTGYVAYRRTC